MTAADTPPDSPDPAPHIEYYCINLARSQTRWASVASAGDAHGVTITRVDALDGKALSDMEIERADLGAFASKNGRDVLPAEIGCFLSHRKAMECFLAGDAEFAVIMEDDMLIDADTVKRVAAVAQVMDPVSVVKLVNHRTTGFVRARMTSEGDQIGRCLFGPQGSAAAYLVTRESAVALLDALVRVVVPYDVALESGWEHHVPVYSTRKPLLAFSDERSATTIAGTKDYDDIKYPARKRSGAASYRMAGHILRYLYALRLYFYRPSIMAFERVMARKTPFGVTWQDIAITAVALACISALWVESDLYRYAGAGLVLFMFGYYIRHHFDQPDKPRIGLAGAACLAWALYVVVRFVSGGGDGSAEGIYAFAALYPTLGYGFYVFVRNTRLLILTFIVVSTLALVSAFDVRLLQEANLHTVHHYNNPIHAALAYALLGLLHLAVLIGGRSATLTVFGSSLTGRLWVLANFVMCLGYVYLLNSKGVWLALAVSLPVALIFLMRVRTRPMTALAGFLLLVGLGGTALYAGYDRLHKTADMTTETSMTLIGDMADGDGLIGDMVRTIENPTTPTSMRVRLEIWVDSLRLIGERPVFGHGAGWEAAWEKRTYKDPDFNLLHNGYIEILVRHGLFGLMFYAAIIGWSLARMYQAAQAGLAHPVIWKTGLVTLVCFLVALATNSFIRLALGESFVWVFVAIGFVSAYQLQAAGKRDPKFPL